jgi:DNA (cytosine-5)-methyltransferase 1
MSKFHLDLFSGIGGFCVAAQACGYTTIGFCEREPYAQQILKERFGAVLADSTGQRLEGKQREKLQGGGNRPSDGSPKLHDDIFTLNGADYAGVDLLTGGFPCQPFSVAGKRLGKADDRAIWPEMLRVIREAQPTCIIGENVAGIVTMELDNILSDLESLGYSAWPLVIPACAVDARHRRDRVWIIARKSLVDTTSAGLPQRGRSERDSSDEKTGAGMVAEPQRSSQDVAYADRQRGRLREANGKDASDARQSPGPGQGQDRRQLEPAICGMADGLPEGLDGGARFCQWPEEDYSTARVTTGIKHRAHRLKGLGNSIVVQVAEEIIRAITNLR